MQNIMRRLGCVVVVMAAAAGCDGREFAEVEGTVTLDGRPLADAEVVFLPDSLAGNAGNTAVGHTDGNGRYKLRAVRDGKDGTVVGPHRVVVYDLTSIPNIVLPGDGPPGAVAKPGAKRDTPRFLLEYTDPLRTPFAAVGVKPGKQTLDFDLKAAEPAGKGK